MDTESHKGSRSRARFRRLRPSVIIAALLGAALGPWIKDALFPSRMDLLRSQLESFRSPGCEIQIEPEDERFFVLRVAPDTGPVLATEISENEIRTRPGAEGSEHLLADSINENSDGSYYATRTVVERDARTSQILRIEGFRCPRMTRYSTDFFDAEDKTPACASELLTFSCVSESR